MPNTVSFQVGTAYTKKRKRMPGTNKVKKAEIKQWNPRALGEGDTYNGMRIYNTLSKTFYAVTGSSSWCPRNIFWPVQGTSSHQRIGAKIFLKCLRFKGYIAARWNNIVGVRWRLRLLRCDNYRFTNITSADTAQTAIIEYLNLLKNNEHPTAGADEWTNTDTVWNMCRHNFYKSVKNVNNNNVIRSKVIASGYIPPSVPNSDITLSGSLTGNAAGAIYLNGTQTPKSFNNYLYSMPLDVKVKCNDYVDDIIAYYIVFEVDTGIGVDYTELNAPYPSLAASGVLIEANFFCRGYFTDC